MKPKHELEILEVLCLRVAGQASELASRQQEGTSVVFGVHTKEANKLLLEGDEKKPYLTFTADCVTYVDGKQPVFQKLYHRDYQVNGKSLVDVKLQAYHEFFTVGLATFFLAAKNTAPEVLNQVSQPV